MGSAADGEMPAETVVETPVAPVAALTAVAPMLDAAAPEATEPSSSKPETEQDTEGKHGCVRVLWSIQRHSESCQRYALAAINQSAGHIKGMAWQLGGSRHEEKVSCKSLLQQLVSNTGKMGTALTKLSEQLEKQGTQNAKRDKQFSDVLLAIQGQIADGYACGSVPAGTPITPTTSVAPGGAASVFPPPAPVMPGYAASVSGGTTVGIGGYGGPVSGSCGAPAPPPPTSPAPAPAPVRSPIMLQLRQPDGSILQRQASPTRGCEYLEVHFRSYLGIQFALVEGEIPAGEAHVNQPEVSGDQAKHFEGVSPMTPKIDEVTEEDAEAIRAAKRARLESEEEKAEDMHEGEAIRKCMHHCQAALEYVARQQKSIQELQAQILEIGAVAHHTESCQKYSLAVANKAANDLRNGMWQLTGSKPEEKTTVKTMLQMLVTSAGKSQSALTKLAEAIQNQNQQSKDQHQHFADVLLQIHGQIADQFSAMRGSAAPAAPASAAMPGFPPVAPAAPITPNVGVPMAETPMTGYAVPAAPMPARPAPPVAPRPRATVTLSLHMNDGSIQTRTASPTPYRDERLRSNPNYVICGDGAFRRLL
eukprot:s1775_g18.t1